jgi:hypothetical protein
LLNAVNVVLVGLDDGILLILEVVFESLNFKAIDALDGFLLLNGSFGQCQLISQSLYLLFLCGNFVFVLSDHDACPAALTLSVLQLPLVLLRPVLPLSHFHPHLLVHFHHFLHPSLKIVYESLKLGVFGLEVDAVAGEGELDAVSIEGVALPDVQLLEGALCVDQTLSLGGRRIQALQLLNDRTVHGLLLAHVRSTRESFSSSAAPHLFMGVSMCVYSSPSNIPIDLFRSLPVTLSLSIFGERRGWFCLQFAHPKSNINWYIVSYFGIRHKFNI